MIWSFILPWPILLFETGRKENLLISSGNIILGTLLTTSIWFYQTNTDFLMIFIAPLFGGLFHAMFTYETYESRERRFRGTKAKTHPIDKLLNILIQMVAVDLFFLIAIVISKPPHDSMISMIASILTYISSLTAIAVSIASAIISRRTEDKIRGMLHE
jgi:hypothetical protein